MLYYPELIEMEFLGHRVGSCITLLENSRPVIKDFVLFYIAIGCTTEMLTSGDISLFRNIHPSKPVIILHCSFNWCVPNDY